ncbi:MAG: PDZ domain-containing protein [Thermogutta sp.]|jgi:membrane-associated protease RseP (regulator of RpoE activity)|nr:PDZ domain-containing protein [Thermogutta terrifontis]
MSRAVIRMTRGMTWVFVLASISGLMVAGGLAQSAEPAPGISVTRVVAAPSEIWIGVVVEQVPEALRAHLDLPKDQGLLVTSVAKDSPAEKAGIKVHDILLEAAGKPLTTPSDLVNLVQEKKDKPIEIKVFRKGTTETVTVTPAPRPAGAWEFPPPFPGTFADPKAWEKWLESFRQRLPGQPPLVFRFYHPGVIVPPGESLNIPKNMTIVITKEGDKPAKIVVQKENQKWEVTENELDKLPPDVRPHVEKMLRGSARPGVVEVKPAVPQEGVPRALIRPWREPSTEAEGRMDKLEEKVKSLENRLKTLEKKLEQSQQPEGKAAE